MITINYFNFQLPTWKTMVEYTQVKNHSNAVTVGCNSLSHLIWKIMSESTRVSALTNAKFAKKPLLGIRPCGIIVGYILERNHIGVTSVVQLLIKQLISKTMPRSIRAKNHIGNFTRWFQNIFFHGMKKRSTCI